MRRFCILIFILALSSSLSSQDYYHWVAFGDQAMEVGDPVGAVRYYEYAFELDSSRQELTYALASAYREVGNYPQALRLYLKVYSKGRGRFFPEGPREIAQLKMYLGEYESAIEFWKRALRRTDDLEQKAWVEGQLQSCSYALSNPIPEEDVELIRLDERINTTESESGATMHPKGDLVFSSLRGAYDENGGLDEPSTYFARLYHSEVDTYGASEAQQMNLQTGFDQVHFLNPRFSPAGDRLFFTLFEENGSQLGMINWEDSTKVIKVLTMDGLPEYPFVGHPFVFTLDEQSFILFSVKRETENSTYDLYWGRLSGNHVHDIKALPSSINSMGNEVTPYYQLSDSLLYFSSDGHPGYGGYDLFQVKWHPAEAGEMSLPQNLGLPLNSSLNDHSLEITVEGGLVTSDRGTEDVEASFCCSDIFRFSQKVEQLDTLFTDNRVPEEIEDISELNRILPIRLYFHNDIPDPGSQSRRTELSYNETVSDYLALEGSYLNEYSQGLPDTLAIRARHQMEEFFREEIQGEYARLESVMKLLHQELEEGHRIEIAIKGYASPLAQSDYNQKLTERRIHSLTNYMREVGDGLLARYMRGDEPRLIIRPIPYGEEQSDAYVSDNPQDAQDSIYSIAAARERRVEILHLQER